MVPQLIARVDGLPLTLLEREVVWPVPDAALEPARLVLPANRRARIERQTAAVHECRLSGWARAFAAAQLAEEERLEIRDELAQAGLL